MPASSPSPPAPAVLLVDNGSLAPAATLVLRNLAAQMAASLGRSVRPVSLLHSSAIAPASLGGASAEILEPTLRRLAEGGINDIVILPLFIGPSAAITDYIPERVHLLRQSWPNFRVRVAPCLVDASQPGDRRLAVMLAKRVQAAASENKFARPAVAIVDHGTPQRTVHAVREMVTAQVREQLGDFALTVAASSMERRPGAEFDFNEPLLQTLLDRHDFSTGEVVVAQLFLLPGRHAGPGGDVEKICRAAESRHPGLKIATTEPLGTHPELLPILQERLEQRGCLLPID